MDKKRFDYHELEEKVYKQFRDSLSEEIDITPYRLIESSKGPDFTISRGEIRLAIIDVETGFFHRHDRKAIEKRITDWAYNGGFRFAVIALEDNTFLLQDCFLNNNNGFIRRSLVEICSILDAVRNPLRVVGKEYRDAVFKKLEELNKGDNSKIEEFLNKYRAVRMSRDNDSFFFEKEEVEDALFECFLQKFDGDKICRYTSLSSIFRTITDGEQGMCCIVGMNDRSECTYADDYIKGLSTTSTKSVKILYDARVENNYFILSCMDDQKYDDLTMWRLYGDDTKGVNILYYVDKKTLNGFKLYHIDYAEQPGNQGHSKLNIIGALLNLNVKGRRFKLRKWDEWKHFFKPYEYRDELEIRLLYNRMNKPANKWIMISPYQIACPLAIFDLRNFPLVIDEIKLGPNCPDKEVNLLQLKLMIEEHRSKMRLSKKFSVYTSRFRSFRL